ncbi:hypothetical protein A3K93_00515 [Acinetobacter sp. NCu2D-2]|nr:hypothetical protein A3K93_00515 [Acinetobacter sp. NCu2D-2]
MHFKSLCNKAYQKHNRAFKYFVYFLFSLLLLFCLNMILNVVHRTQAPKNNQQVWRELEEATRAIVTKQKLDVYVVTGPIFAAKKLKTIGKGVIVPTATYKAIYLKVKEDSTRQSGWR